MNRIFAILLFLGLTSCHADQTCSSWKVIEAGGNNPFLNDISELSFDEKEIVFINPGESRKYTILTHGDRMVIVYGQQKMLVKLEYAGDSLLEITELYQKNPLRLKLTKNLPAQEHH
jgi:hypothetical protein